MGQLGVEEIWGCETFFSKTNNLILLITKTFRAALISTLNLAQVYKDGVV